MLPSCQRGLNDHLSGFKLVTRTHVVFVLNAYDIGATAKRVISLAII